MLPLSVEVSHCLTATKKKSDKVLQDSPGCHEYVDDLGYHPYAHPQLLNGKSRDIDLPIDDHLPPRLLQLLTNAHPPPFFVNDPLSLIPHPLFSISSFLDRCVNYLSENNANPSVLSN